jgi:UDP-3-O-[3-hydroxymyristoyl] N-acetylglucosamine deacetylase
MTRVRLTGRALHTGEEVDVTLTARAGPIDVVVDGVRAPIADMTPECADHASALVAAGGSPALGTVEHLLAALFAHRITGGLEISVARAGPSSRRAEMPLLDGGAAAWSDALLELGPLEQTRHAPWRVTRATRIVVGDSVYELTPSDETRFEVEVELGPVASPRASWGGDLDDFRRRVAPARTFALARDVEALGDRGLAVGAARESVVVVAEHGLLAAGRDAAPDEPARHKLLDLVGDMYAYACVFVGTVSARRPGHAASHEVLRRARREGALACA